MWERIWDAIWFIRAEGGVPSEEVLSYSPSVFKEVYRSLKRRETERTVVFLYAANQAVNGDKKSIGNFVSALEIWGGKAEDSAGKLASYKASLSA